MSESEKKISRRDVTTALVSATTAGVLVEGVNLSLQHKEVETKEEKHVGGTWKNEQNQDVKGKLTLRFKTNASNGATVHHVTFTTPAEFAPNVPVDPTDWELGPYDKIVGKSFFPDKNGEHVLEVDLDAIGAPKGKIYFDANVLGNTVGGYITSETVNYDPNGSLHLKHI